MIGEAEVVEELLELVVLNPGTVLEMVEVLKVELKSDEALDPEELEEVPEKELDPVAKEVVG